MMKEEASDPTVFTLAEPTTVAAEKAPAVQLPGDVAQDEGAPSGEAEAASAVDSELLRQQLQLIQLCFAEHEFGVVVSDSDEDKKEGNSSTCVVEQQKQDVQFSYPCTSGKEEASGTSDVPTFDPLLFIQDKLRHGVPLDALSNDLKSYQQYLEEKIAHCVNTEVHTAFVSVSGHLVGMKDELTYIQRPLSSALESLTSAAEQLSAITNSVKAKVDDACTVETERMFDATQLKCLLLYESIAYRLDDLTQELRLTTSSSHRSIAAATTASSEGGRTAKREALVIPAGVLLSEMTVKAVEDIVLLLQALRETEQILFPLPSRTNERAEVVTYVAAAVEAVMSLLEAILVYSCQQAASTTTASQELNSSKKLHENGSLVSSQLLERVIQLYSLAGIAEGFCVVFRDAVLRPPLEAVVSWKAATQARQSVSGTVSLLREMKEVIETQYLPLLPLLRSNFQSMPLHPVATVLWPIVCETLVKKLPSLYEVGIPNQFHRKYIAAYELLALAEAACVDEEELLVLRQSPDVVLWNHKWNLDVYAALRISEVDQAMSTITAPLETQATEDSGYHLRLFELAAQQFLQLFSETVWIYSCTPKFIRQIVVGSQKMLQQVKDAIGASQPRGDGVASGEPALKADGRQPSPPLIRSCLYVVTDTQRFRRFIEGSLRDAVRRCVGGGEAAEVGAAATESSTASFTADRSTAALLDDALLLCSNPICGDFIEAIETVMRRHIISETELQLQNIKSVRSAYSHTRKTLPTAASWYVSSVMEPVLRFAAEAAACGYTAGTLQDSIKSILMEIAAHFTAIAKETLVTAKKTEEGWEKLRRRREGGAGMASPVATGESEIAEPPQAPFASSSSQEPRVTVDTATDRDKMTIQLWMDAVALCDACQRPPLQFSPDVAAEIFSSAFALLRRAEWIRGADIPEPPDVTEM